MSDHNKRMLQRRKKLQVVLLTATPTRFLSLSSSIHLFSLTPPLCPSPSLSLSAHEPGEFPVETRARARNTRDGVTP